MSLAVTRRVSSSGQRQLVERCTRRRGVLQSRADFIHKVRVAAKELRESLYWLKLAQHVPLTTDPQVIALIREADELVAIFMASAKTAKGR